MNRIEYRRTWGDEMKYELTYYSELTKRNIEFEFDSKEQLADQILRITKEDTLGCYSSINWRVISWDK
jgi:hypothetical protein